MPVEFDLTGLHDEHTIRANVPPPLSELCDDLIGRYRIEAH